MVFFDEPTGDSYYGGAVAGPVFAKIMEEILPYLNVETKYTEDEAGSVGVSAPNVIGKTVSEATNELTNSGLKILVKGSGDTVIAQTPDPGSSVPSKLLQCRTLQTVHCRMSTTWLHKQG